MDTKTCSICGQSFSDEEELKTHMVDLHTIKEDGSKGGETTPPSYNPITGQGGE